MMSPGVSPAPSDVPVNKDDAGDGDRQDDLGLNVIDNGIIANNEGDESESSSDENGDEVYNEHSYNGYIALEQQSVDTVAGDDGDVSWESSATQSEANEVGQPNEVVPEFPASIQNSPFQITDTDAEVIKQAMAGFSLPTNNIPEWARVVPEENWKSKLLDSIAKKQ